MKVLEYPETRQVFYFDCGANLLVSALVFAGVEEREDRVALFARTRKAGTGTIGVLNTFNYEAAFRWPRDAANAPAARHRRRPSHAHHDPSLSHVRPAYRELWNDGHSVAPSAMTGIASTLKTQVPSIVLG